MILKGPENEKLVSLIHSLERDKRGFWKQVARLLAKPKRQRVSVNVSKIDRFAEDGNTVIVPGKVLSNGEISKPVIVAAFAFSKDAKVGIEKAGGKAITLEEAHKSLKNFKDVVLLV
jgi:large subunit ribosomal protein L18e